MSAAELTLNGFAFGRPEADVIATYDPRGPVAAALEKAMRQDYKERFSLKHRALFRIKELRKMKLRDWGGLVLWAASMGLTNTAAKAQLTALSTSYDAGTAAVIQFYTTARATNVDTAIGAQTLLGTCTMSASAFGAPAGSGGTDATITAAAISDDTSADATGTVVWARISTQSGGTAISDHNCGTAASDFIFNTVSITSGSVISVTSFVITQPIV